MIAGRLGSRSTLSRKRQIYHLTLSRLAERAGRDEAELMSAILAAQALPGLMQPADIVGPYLFLASDGAANITGQSLGIDRGEAPW